MPRNPGTRASGGLTAASIGTLLPPSLVLLSDINRPASSRRRLPKNIPLLQTEELEPAPVSLSHTSSPTKAIAAGFGELGARVGHSLPVVRAGATFLSTLHASVALSASVQPPSNPSSGPPSPYLYPSPYRSSFPPAPTSNPNDNYNNMASSATSSAPGGPPTKPLPSLDFVAASTPSERVDALKLVADSIAQRRQLASYAIMTHPYFLGLLGIAFSGVYSYLYRVPGDGWLVFTTCVGILMAGFVAIRSAVAGYIELAERLNLHWLGEDAVVVARWGDGEHRKVIGACVYSVEKVGGAGNGRKGKKVALVRAWTTRQRERAKGVGKGLIEETVRQAKAKGCEDVRWQEGNIYEQRKIPAWAHAGFEEGLRECRKKLEAYVVEYMKT